MTSGIHYCLFCIKNELMQENNSQKSDRPDPVRALGKPGPDTVSTLSFC
jgi:hypothetical protein